MALNKTVIQSTPPSTIGHVRVDFKKESFDALFPQKGYNAIWEKSIKCPCNSENNDHPKSDCQNCGSTGIVFYNPIQTRVISHSQNMDTKYKEWSEERLGNSSLTIRDSFKISFMDRFTYIDAESVHNERIYPKELTDGLGTATYAFTWYPIIRMEAAFLFVNSSTKLTLLEEGVDYTISNNVITFVDNSYDGKTVTIRYIHRPQYLVIDTPRETMVTSIKDKKTGKSQEVLMPIHAMCRRSHYVLDAENRQGTRLLDNSYTV